MSFTASDPGVIAMRLDDRIVVVFNATPEAVRQPVAGRAWALHPVQANGGDPVVKGARFEAGALSVPARTVAVFVKG